MIARIITGKQLNLLLRLLLAVVFLYAAWSKVQHPHEFAISIRAYKVIPVSLSNLFALAMSWSELVAGALLLLGFYTRKAAAAVFVLLVTFTIAIATVIVRGQVVDCGCFGPEGSSSTGPLLLVRNLALLVAAFLVMRYNDGFLGIDGATSRGGRRLENTQPTN